MAFKNFKKLRFTQVTASVNTKHQDTYRKIPASLRLGKKSRNQGGFFDYNSKIQQAIDKTKGSSLYDDNSVFVEQDPITEEVGVFIKSEIFREIFKDFIPFKFQSQAATQISRSFFEKIGKATTNMPLAERYVGILATPFEAGSIGTEADVISPVTASIKLLEAPGIAYNPNGSLRNRKVTYLNTSSNFTNSHFFFGYNELTSNSTTGDFGDDKQEAASNALVAAGKIHLTRSFTAHTNVPASRKFYYVQSTPVRKFSVEMTSSNFTASFFALTSSFSSSADFGVISGSFIGKVIESSSTQPRFYNGTNSSPSFGSGDDTDGSYLFVVQKGITEGEGEFAFNETKYEGDSGSNAAFTPQQLLIWYPTKYTYDNVRSASFYFTPYPENMNKLNTGATTKALVTGSISSSEAIGTGELRTVYWLNHTYTSSFTASFGNFTRGQLRNLTGNADHHQLPYINTSLREFGKKGTISNSSHLWKDSALSQPVDEGYYVHSASFSQESKNQMSASLGSANHTSSFFVYGSFTHPFIALNDGPIMNYTGSQIGEKGLDGDSFMSYHPILSCVFLKRFDNQVFQFQPKDGQAVISESVG